MQAKKKVTLDCGTNDEKKEEKRERDEEEIKRIRQAQMERRVQKKAIIVQMKYDSMFFVIVVALLQCSFHTSVLICM